MVMHCEQARNLFDAYLNGELSPALETELAAHRLQCPDCRHELAMLEVVGHVVAADGDDEHTLDDAFTDRLMACLDERRIVPARPHWRPLALWGGGLAAAAAIAITSTILINRPHPQVLGVRQEKVVEPVDLGLAADSLVHDVETNWQQHYDNAQDVVRFGEMTIMQILDRLGIDEAVESPEPFEVMPDSFDELVPREADKHVEEL
jgi:hypothetical protein